MQFNYPCEVESTWMSTLLNNWANDVKYFKFLNK